MNTTQHDYPHGKPVVNPLSIDPCKYGHDKTVDGVKATSCDANKEPRKSETSEHAYPKYE